MSTSDSKRSQKIVSAISGSEAHLISTDNLAGSSSSFATNADRIAGSVINPVMADEKLLALNEDPLKENNKLNSEYDGEESESAGKRETWGNKFDFLLSIIGFAVDLANVWRFPYYCYKNGGGAFLIPYFLMLIFGAVPLFYMELLLGQFHKQGAISLWKIVPVFKGVGWTIVTVSYLVSFYYNTIIAWSVYYFFASFTSSLPWTSCGNSWNTCRCWSGASPISANGTNGSYSVTIECDGQNITADPRSLSSPTTEYFERGMLKVHKSEGLSDLGIPEWDVTLCLMLTYTIIYFATWKGVKTSGKVVYITAVMPYVILLILFIRGLFLEGATKGLFYFANPNISRLSDPVVWIEAAFQVFYSVGAGFGVHLAMASYNRFHNNCYLDCLITAGVNSFTSLFAGCTVFIYLGYMSETMGKPIQTVASQGPSLIFEVYPQAIATLPGSTAWSLLFFFMVIMLGMDSSMGGLESVATGIIDEFGSFFKKYRWHREIFMGVIISMSFLISLAGVTSGGLFIVTLLDNFAAGASLLLVVFFEAVAIGWFYGLDQFCKDAKAMLGWAPGIYWRICWKFISPIFLCAIVVCNIITFQPLVAELSYRTVIFPTWGNMIGWMLVILALLPVPVIAVYTIVFKYRNSSNSTASLFAMSISPENEHDQIKRGDNPSRFQLSHWLSLGYHDCGPRRNNAMDTQLAMMGDESSNTPTYPQTTESNGHVL